MTAPTLDTRDYAGSLIPTSGTFDLDPAHTRVGFVARHLMVSKVRGSFTQVTGKITIDADPLKSSVDVHIPVASIDTGVGELTIRDVTREVTLDVEYEGVARNPWGSEVIGFTASTEIDREDFGMTWNVALETGGVLVGKKVKIEISAEGIRQV